MSVQLSARVFPLLFRSCWTEKCRRIEADLEVERTTRGGLCAGKTGEMDEVVVEVSGLAPAKGEALSMLGAGHSHRPRVEALLQEARRAMGEGNCPLGDSLMALSW